jgi:basic membrane protein A and related proteins
MKRFGKVALGVFLVLLAASLTMCQRSEKQEPEEMEVEVLKIGMVTDVGGVNDNSFNQSAWEGLQMARDDLGVQVSYLESGQGSDYGPNMETMYDAGNDLIWGIGFLMADAIYEAAASNPDINYAIIDMAWGDTPDNLLGVVFAAQEPSFLVGYIAAKMTETGTVGFVGGIAGDIIDGFDYGYHAGVKYADPSVTVLRQYADSFTDAAIGKSIANQMYLQGADIIFSAAGLVGDGVIEAAKEQGLWAIGVDKDQSFLAPDNVLTSAMKRVDMAIYAVAEELTAGNFAGGTAMLFSLANGGVGVAPTSDTHVPASILAEVADLEEMIISGDVKVPYNAATYAEYGY